MMLLSVLLVSFRIGFAVGQPMEVAQQGDGRSTVTLATPMDGSMRFPLFPTDYETLANRSTRVSVLQALHTFEQVKLLPFGEAIMRVTETELNNISSYFVPQWKWGAASAFPAAPIVILGSSVTGGSGAGESTDPNERAAGTADLSRGYSIRQSWGRHFVDFLNQHLVHHHHGVAKNVSIFYKSAAGPSYFSMCTESFIPPDTRIVLVEAPSRMISSLGIKSDLTRIASAVRRVAPNAVVVFVEWPSLQHEAELATLPNLMQLDAAAMELKVDTLRVDHVIRAIASHCTHGSDDPTYSKKASSHKDLGPRLGKLNREFPCYHQLYANRAKDAVHPNPWGHQLLGALAARHVARALVAASTATTVATTAAGLAAVEQHKDPPSPSAPSNGQLEICYLSAPTLPLNMSASHGNWNLVDEGQNGIKKLGYLSRQIGDVLALDLLQDFPRKYTSSNCGFLGVTLYYLLSTSTPDQGAFKLTCDGCRCEELSTARQELVNPFPLIETNANLISIYSGNNISITAQTQFLAYYSNTSTCTLHVTHIPSGSSLPKLKRMQHTQQRSRIRIDWLFIAPMPPSSLAFYPKQKPYTRTAKLVRYANSSGCRM